MIDINLQRLQDSNERIKSNIANAYGKCEEKGAELPTVQDSTNLADTIESIPQDLSGWKPQEDWWDIDRVLEEDTEDYVAKIICLLDDSERVSSLYGMNAAKIRTSDGSVYENVGDLILHEWDVSKDKACSLGYKTRYVIYYYGLRDVYFNMNFNARSLYLIFENVQGVSKIQVPFKGLSVLEYVEMRNASLLINEQTYYNCGALVKIPSFDVAEGSISVQQTFTRSNDKVIDLSRCVENRITTLNTAFSDSRAQKVLLFSTGNVTNFFASFMNMSFLRCINGLNFASASEVRSLFSGCSNLREIGEVLNIGVSGINLKDCVLLNYETLLRFIDALYDYSEDREGTHMITFGSTNLAKLTEEELAIGQNKGWTIS